MRLTVVDLPESTWLWAPSVSIPCAAAAAAASGRRRAVEPGARGEGRGDEPDDDHLARARLAGQHGRAERGSSQTYVDVSLVLLTAGDGRSAKAPRARARQRRGKRTPWRRLSERIEVVRESIRRGEKRKGCCERARQIQAADGEEAGGQGVLFVGRSECLIQGVPRQGRKERKKLERERARRRI